MAKTKVVIGYSPNQLVRRVTRPPAADDPANWDEVVVPRYVTWLQGLGMGVLVVSLADYNAIGPDALLARQFSRKKTSDRCAVVNGQGTVIAIKLADPQLDQHALGRLIADPHRKATVGVKARDVGLI